MLAGEHCLDPVVHWQKSGPEGQGRATFLGGEKHLWVQQPGLAGGKETEQNLIFPLSLYGRPGWWEMLRTGHKLKDS